MFLHPESGLYLTHYRVYDPKDARWLSRDPIGEIGGVNLYAYANNNPMTYFDLEGTEPKKGERGQAAKPSGTGNEFKRMRPHPTDPN